MVVFCPGCGSKISVEPEAPGGSVECPRCHSTFATAGLKSTDNSVPVKRFRPKKAGRSILTNVLLVLAVLLILGAGTTAALWFAGVIHFSGSTGGFETVKSKGRPGWKEFDSSEAHVRALFPGDPKRAVRRTKDVAFELEKDGAAYGIVFADLDQARIKGKTPEQIIQQQHDQWSAGAGGKLVSEKDVSAGAVQGKEFVVDLPSGKAFFRYFATGRRLYTVVVVGKTRPPDPADVAMFLDSFEITS
jgi:hypothetical protein